LEDVLLDLRKDRLIHGCHGQEHRHGTALCLPGARDNHRAVGPYSE
jgi:hypothetical protein